MPAVGNVITGSGTVPTAGTTNQVLQKNSNTNYDVGWVSLSAGGNVSNSGTPTSGQSAQWTSATAIKGVTFASLQVNGQNPTNTSSLTAVHAGLGTATFGTCVITPTATGKIFVTITGQIRNDTASDGSNCQIRYGTGTAPNNGVAFTGTATGTIVNTLNGSLTNVRHPFSVSGVITGLALATAVWLDLAQTSVTGGATTMTNVSVSAYEIP
jgi:hypothetical protein